MAEKEKLGEPGGSWRDYYLPAQADRYRAAAGCLGSLMLDVKEQQQAAQEWRSRRDITSPEPREQHTS